MSLADAILVVHAIVVLFIVASVPVSWCGYFRGWGFVRNFWFRTIHLLLIGIVALESVFSISCPLTVWEDVLRGNSGGAPTHPNGFIAHWLRRLLFYDFPAWVFTTAYLIFFLLVVATFFCVRPQPPKFRYGIFHISHPKQE